MMGWQREGLSNPLAPSDKEPVENIWNQQDWMNLLSVAFKHSRNVPAKRSSLLSLEGFPIVARGKYQPYISG